MNTVFATLLLAGLCLQGALANKGRKQARSAQGFDPSVPRNGSWITRASMYHENLYQGDIKLNAEQERKIQERKIYNSTERQGIRDTRYLWPKNNAGVVRIPYRFTNNHNTRARNVIRRAMDEYASATCFEFVERTNERDYIRFISDGGCWSYLGRQGGRQDISLDNDGCVSHATAQHEIMHAVGFDHEQSRYDRDEYVTIFWDNICCGAASQFEKTSADEFQLHDQPYDPISVMHYDEYAFSTRYGVRKTIEAKDNTSPLGNEEGLTNIDIAKNNHLYDCSATDPDESDEESDEGSDETTTQEPSTTEPSTTEGPSCEDEFGRWCERSARRLCNHRLHRAFMMENCAAACGECDNGWCHDSYPICGSLARQGWCNNGNADWMEFYCPESCGVDCDAV